MPSTLGIVASHRSPAPLPIPAAGLVGWWDASDAATVTASAGAVSQWADKSGGNRHVVQTTASMKPATGTATQNGRNVLAFDGGDWLRYAGTTGLNVGSVTVFIVGKQNDTIEDTGMFVAHDTTGHDYNGTTQFGITTGKVAQYVSAERASAQGVFAGTGPAPWGVYTVRLNPSGLIEAWANGTAGATGSAGSGFGVAAGGWLIGGRWISGAVYVALMLNGQIGEIVVYDRVVTNTERQQVESYLKTRWGTP